MRGQLLLERKAQNWSFGKGRIPLGLPKRPLSEVCIGWAVRSTGFHAHFADEWGLQVCQLSWSIHTLHWKVGSHIVPASFPTLLQKMTATATATVYRPEVQTLTLAPGPGNHFSQLYRPRLCCVFEQRGLKRGLGEPTELLSFILGPWTSFRGSHMKEILLSGTRCGAQQPGRQRDFLLAEVLALEHPVPQRRVWSEGYDHNSLCFLCA